LPACFAELEKTRLVLTLRAARERKREKEGKCEGRRWSLAVVISQDQRCAGAGSPYDGWRQPYAASAIQEIIGGGRWRPQSQNLLMALATPDHPQCRLRQRRGRP
jgi:hypothetical protein